MWQFYGVRAAAANITDGDGNYSPDDFRADYPQFFSASGDFLGSQTMLESILRMTNANIRPGVWASDWRYAAGLYTAHYVTLSLRGYAGSSETAEAAAASGALVGAVRSATLGDASVQYDTTALTAGTEDWGDLNGTAYGQILANRAKLVGLAWSYVI